MKKVYNLEARSLSFYFPYYEVLVHLHVQTVNQGKKALPYFFGYNTELFFFQNNLKDLDPSCKTDLDLLDCLGRVNLEL